MLKRCLFASVALVASLALVGCETGGGSNTVIDGVDGPNVSVSNGLVTMNFIFKNVTIDGGASIPIPNFTNSSLYVGPDFQSNGMLLRVTVSAADFFDGQDMGLDPQTLPGGRPLPTVADGALPAVAMVVPQLNNTVLYVGTKVMGFFVPFDGLNLEGAIISSNFYNTDKQKIGTLSLVGSDQNKKNSGILLLLSTSLMGIDMYRPAKLN